MRKEIKTLIQKSGIKKTKFGQKVVRFRKVWKFTDFYLDTVDTLKRNPPFDFAYINIDRTSPSMSPNIWSMIKDIINEYKSPSVLEYGMGISTYHICKMLYHSTGSYEGMEHNTAWFRIVEHWIQMLLAVENQGSDSSFSTHLSLKLDSGASSKMSLDVVYHPDPSKIKLLLRPVIDYSGDGSFEDFYEYVTAPSGEYDVIIVDGRCRNGTLKQISEKNMIKKGGTLILHDAYQKIYKEGISFFHDGRYIDGRGGFKNPLNPEQRPEIFCYREAYVWTRHE